MAPYLYKTLILFLILFSTAGNIYSQRVHRIHGSPYPASRTPDTLYVIDDTKLSQEQQFAVQSLQGLLARYRPQIYRVSDKNSVMWLSQLSNRHGVYVKDTYMNDWQGLIRHFKDSVSGYVLCKMYGSSQNTALSLCGILNAIAVPEPVDKDLPFLQKLADVRTGITEEDVYLKHYKDMSKDVLVYQNEDNATYLGDYSVFAGAFRFYTPRNVVFTNGVLRGMNTDGVLLSANDHDLINMASRNSVMAHTGSRINNLSTLTNFNMSFKQKENHSTFDTIHPNIHTVCFLMTGGEDMEWLTGDFVSAPEWYNSPERGSFPLGWTLSPALCELAPPVMRYIYEHANNSSTGRDYFVAAPSGMGYLFPDAFEEITANTDMMSKYLAEADMNIVNVHGLTNSPDLSAYTLRDNVASVFYYTYPDYTGWKGKIVWSYDKPIIGARHYLAGNRETPQSLADKLNKEVKNQFQPDGYSLIAVESSEHSVEDVKKCISMLNTGIRVVSPDDFVKLIQKNLGVFLYQNYPNPVTDRTTISFKLPYKQRVTVSVSGPTGAKFKTLFDGYADAGITKLEFSKEDNMTKGIYICTLSTLNHVKNIKIEIE